MLLLGIESSCDETALCLLEMKDDSWRIVSEAISSQTEVHVEYGGVVPELAAREHLAHLPLLYEEVAAPHEEEIDALAVTVGPGLKGCLLTGALYAQGLSKGLDIPVYGVNHIEGHLLAPLLENPSLSFPYLALVVSGGHTEIHLVEGVGEYTLFSRTIDDAAGEAFDKSAHLLGFPYPGGPQLAALADSYTGEAGEPLPTVMKGKPGFSFSGLKTAIALRIQAAGEVSGEERQKLAAVIQDGIVQSLIAKLEKAMEATGCRTLTVTGGVAANRSLRERVAELSSDHFFPDMKHCMDNAAMIAFCAAKRLQVGQTLTQDLGVHPRWPVETSVGKKI